MSTEAEEITIVQENPVRHVRRRMSTFETWLYCIGTVAALGGVGYALYLVRDTLVIVGYAIEAGIITVPIVSIVYAGVHLWKKFNQVQVVDIAERGTVLLDRRGNIRVFSTTDVYAGESVREITRVLPPAIQQTAQDIPFPYDDAIYTSVNDMETVEETGGKQVVNTYGNVVETPLIEAHQQAKQQVEDVERAILKRKIRAWKATGLPDRTIAPMAKLSGRRYPEYLAILDEITKEDANPLTPVTDKGYNTNEGTNGSTPLVHEKDEH